MKIDLVWPLEPGGCASSRAASRRLVVVDSRRAYLEEQVRAALYDADARPEIVGGRDERGRALARAAGRDHRRRRSRRISARGWPSASARRARGEAGAARGRARARRRGAAADPRAALLQRLSRTRRRRRVPDGSLAGGGIGCHTMALHDARARGAASRRDGLRGRALDRPRALHRRGSPVPEPGRRDLLPLGPARGARVRRGRRDDHLQAALERRRRDDRRPGGDRREAAARARARPALGRRAPRGGDERRPRARGRWRCAYEPRAAGRRGTTGTRRCASCAASPA